MKRKFFLAVAVFLFLSSLSSAQDNLHRWIDGPLSWDNFKSVASPDGNRSYIRYYISYEPMKTRNADGSKTKYYNVDAFMLTDDSWVDANERTDLNLRYNQLIFDQLEINRRRMAKMVLSASGKVNLDGILASTKSNLDFRLATIRTATKDGIDTSALAFWEEETRRELESLPIISIPHYEPDLFSGAISLGPTVIMPFLGTGRYFSLGAGMYLDFDFGFNNHILYAKMYIAGAEAERRIYFQTENGTAHILTKGKNTNPSGFFMCYGYRLLEKNRFNLTPMAGWSWGNYNLVDNDISAYANCNGFVIGLGSRFHLSRTYRPYREGIFFYGDVSELSLLSIDANIFLKQNLFPKNLDDSFNGWSLMFSLGISLGGHTTKIAAEE